MEDFKNYLRSSWSETPSYRKVSMTKEHMKRAALGKNEWNSWAEELAKKVSNTGNYIIYFENVTFEDVRSFKGFNFPCAVDFRGSVFKHSVYFDQAKFELGAFFDRAEFCSLVSFSDTRFSTIASFKKAIFNSNSYFRCTKFDGRTNFQSALSRGPIVFDSSTFNNTSSFERADFQMGPSFNETTFHQAPSFHDAAFEQGIDFRGAKFTDCLSSHAVSDYRTLKIAMNRLLNKYQEGVFYSLEQRALRLQSVPKMPFLSRLISKAYELSSDYGQSIFQPLGFLGGLTIGVIPLYVFLKHSITDISDYIMLGFPNVLDNLDEVVSFAMLNLVSPFKVWSDKHGSNYMTGTDPGSELTIKLLSTFQSILSLALITLFILSVRRAFKMS